MADFEINKIRIPYPTSLTHRAMYIGVNGAGKQDIKDQTNIGNKEYTEAKNYYFEQDEPLHNATPLGNPVYSNLDIVGDDYLDNNGKTRNYPNFVADSVLFTVNQSKNIVKTSINGLNGTVKEYIADGDFVVSIAGVLTGANGAYPFNDVMDLKRVLQAPVSLQVNSWYLNRLGIYRLVVESYNLPQEQGGISQQRFEIHCLSDIDYEIYENK